MHFNIWYSRPKIILLWKSIDIDERSLRDVISACGAREIHEQRDNDAPPRLAASPRALVSLRLSNPLPPLDALF